MEKPPKQVEFGPKLNNLLNNHRAIKHNDNIHLFWSNACKRCQSRKKLLVFGTTGCPFVLVIHSQRKDSRCKFLTATL